MRKIRKSALGAALLVLLIAFSACKSGGSGTGTGGDSGEPKGTIKVGVSAAFAENQIVAEMYALVLEKAGYKVERQMTLGQREISQPALEKGEIDVKPEYLGTLLKYLDPASTPSGDPEANVEPIKKLLEPKGIELLEFSKANDTNAFVVTKETASKHSLKTVGDLKPVASQLILGGPPECETRPFCLPGLKSTYGIEGFKEFKQLDVGGSLTVAALKEKAIDVALLFSTSSVIKANDWVLLEDDKKLQTADNIAPVIRKAVLDDEVEELLNEVSAALTTENITDLNKEVEIDKKDPKDVAEAFLKKEKLL